MAAPTRTADVLAIVTPPARAAAALSPILAGRMLSASPVAWSFVIGDALGIGYDLELPGMFRRVRPPEEAR